MGGHYDGFDDLPDRIKDYVHEINSEIVSCANCQPYDKEERTTVWVYGDNYEISDLLNDNDIPEEDWDAIIPYLKCPSCGRVFEDCSDDVGVTSRYEAEFYEKYDEIAEKTKGPIQSFYDLITRCPYLGLEHEIGKKIAEEIKSMPLKTITNAEFYRARKPENSKLFTHKDMLNPPPNTENIWEGRFNHYGQSHLYLGSSEELCAKEIAKKEKELLWMQKFKINNLTMVLDVSEYIDQYNIDKIPLVFAGLLLSGKIIMEKSKDISWTPEYFIPRFIADIAKLNNINGIIYGSTKANGRNIVIFDPSKCKYEFDGDPYTFIFDRKSYTNPDTKF